MQQHVTRELEGGADSNSVTPLALAGNSPHARPTATGQTSYLLCVGQEPEAQAHGGHVEEDTRARLLHREEDVNGVLVPALLPERGPLLPLLHVLLEGHGGSVRLGWRELAQRGSPREASRGSVLVRPGRR